MRWASKLFLLVNEPQLPRNEHPVCPCLLKGKRIRYPNQAWATNITYLRLDGGFVYLAAIMDLDSRKIPRWRISLDMEADFCTEALNDAIDTYGAPAMFNTDQGSQFTSCGFIQMLQDAPATRIFFIVSLCSIL